MSTDRTIEKWGSTEDLFTVVCRPALPKDTQQVMDLTRLIWEGDDYVAYVWEEWLSDYEGTLAVAEYGGRVIGLGKLSILAAGQWWLEGLRVHPDFQGRGIGSHIHSYLLDRWLQEGDGIIRLTTSSKRELVHHMSENSGFRKVGEFIPFKASVLNETCEEFTPVSLGEVSKGLDYVYNCETMKFSAHLMDLGWQWVRVNLQNLSEAAERGHLWWWREGEGLVAIWEEDWEEETSAVLMFAACELREVEHMLVDYRKLAASIGHKWAAWFAPTRDNLMHLLEKAGFRRDSDHSVLVFELEHP